MLAFFSHSRDNSDHTGSSSKIRGKSQEGIICHRLIGRPDISKSAFDQDNAGTSKKSSQEAESQQCRNVCRKTDHDHTEAEKREAGEVDWSSAVSLREMRSVDGREKDAKEWHCETENSDALGDTKCLWDRSDGYSVSGCSVHATQVSIFRCFTAWVTYMTNTNRNEQAET